MQFGGPGTTMYGRQPQYTQYNQGKVGGASYGTLGGGWGGPAPQRYLGAIAKPRERKRMNVLAIALNVFLPWALFCLIAAMLSFDMHYKQAGLCRGLAIAAAVISLLMGFGSLLGWQQPSPYDDQSESGTPSSWLFFLSGSCLLATSLAFVFGSHNYHINSEPFYDVTALNSYTAVDPTAVRGQELMDAGQVTFTKGSHLDLTKSMGFKNDVTYCVAPITMKSADGIENPPLASYDFWAVGKDCCSGSQADFRCGEYDNPYARAGVRLLSDEERAFFRLAVQQAQSAHEIKAIHPLFFHWVQDPVAETYSYQQSAYQAYLLAMFGYLAGQCGLVAFASSVFAKLSEP